MEEIRLDKENGWPTTDLLEALEAAEAALKPVYRKEPSLANLYRDLGQRSRDEAHRIGRTYEKSFFVETPTRGQEQILAELKSDLRAREEARANGAESWEVDHATGAVEFFYSAKS